MLANHDLLRLWAGLSADQQQVFFQQIRQTVEENDNLVTLDEMLLRAEFREEARVLARGAGLDLLEFAIAVNPHHYESYTARSRYCRVDRYRISTGQVDLRVQVYDRVQFEHRMIPASFALHVLSGSIIIYRDGLALRFDAGAVIDVEGNSTIRIVARAGARFLYVDHPLTAWVREHFVRKDAGL